MSEFEPVHSDAALAGALNALFVASTLLSADHVPRPKASRASPRPRGAGFYRHQQRLIELVVRRAGGGLGAVSDKELLRETRFVQKDVGEAIATQGDSDAMTEQVKIGAPYAIATLAALLNNESLEQQQVELKLELADDADGFTLQAKHLTLEASCLGLLDLIHGRLHGTAQEVPVLALERAASRWWYDQESPPTESPPDRRVARTIREREWSLTERESFATGMTVLEIACAAGVVKALPPRARRMAESARRSRLGVFAVRELSGTCATLEDVAQRERVTMREHEPECAMAPGTVIVGRLYPFGDGVYLRSPGAWVLDEASVPPPETLLEWAGILLRHKYPMAMALESAMRYAILDPVPDLRRDVAPAGSREEARKKLDAFRAAMDRAGMFVNPESRDALWLEPGDEEGCWTIFGWEADLALAGWVETLMEVAGIARDVRKG